MKFFFVVAWAVFFSTTIFGQDKISGKVVSDKGEALAGASVFISNTTVGATTNVNGEFILDNLPNGSIQLVISFVGYETNSVVIEASMRSKKYLIQLQPQSNELEGVVVGKFDKGGWKKWGETFTEVFIGTSAYAKNCVINNTDALRFVYNSKKKILYAYANEPLQVDNYALGYHISVSLVDFKYETGTGIIDYQTYALFSEMEGTEEQQLEWQGNREKVYAYSLMHFMRALYNQNLKNEGFQVRRIETMANVEKQRVQQLYKTTFAQLKDSLKDMDDASINKAVERSFSKDSLGYYKKVLDEEDRTANMHFNLEAFKDIATATDSNTVLLHFNDYLQVTYIKAKEPEEYLAYKNKIYIEKNILTKNDVQQLMRGFPTTELMLTQNIPVEISEQGYFINVDLFINGFWGWWEKMATRLPYEYEP